MKEFQLSILAAGKLFYQGSCVSLVVPTITGKQGIMANFCNTIGAIVAGTLEFEYIDGDGNEAAYTGAAVEYLSALTENRTLTEGWYLLSGTVAGDYALTVDGEAHIILADGSDWQVSNVIVGAEDTLYIYAQSTGDAAGKLTVSGNIGGEDGAAALKHDRPYPLLDKRDGCEDTGGAETDDDSAPSGSGYIRKDRRDIERRRRFP